jgi:hypothetical protein
MRNVAICLLLSAAALAANPIMEVALSEIRTAPDSCEFIELHVYNGGEYDLSGATLTTGAGTAVIDSGVYLSRDGYVVIDSTNTSGTFGLGDSADSIMLDIPYGPEFRCVYPANPHREAERSWAPPPGASASIFQWWEWDPGGDWYDVYTWYVDETPTPGSANDDTLGGIGGYVRDDHGQPVNEATVRMTASQGTAEMRSGHEYYWPDGYFEQCPTGPGTFTVTAECPGYLPGAYPDTIVLAPNELRQITITLNPVGVADEKAQRPSAVKLRQRGRNLILTADRPGKAHLIVRDNLGRECLRTEINLLSGSTEVPLANLRSGVYFASCGFWERTSTAKLVLY